MLRGMDEGVEYYIAMAPRIEAGFILVRGDGRKERYPLAFDGARWRTRLFVSRKDVALVTGSTEEYLHGLEDAWRAACLWNAMDFEERRDWAGDSLI